MFLSVDEVAKQIGTGRSTVRHWVKQGKFPPPVKISARMIRWRQEDVQAWMDAQPMATPSEKDSFRL